MKKTLLFAAALFSASTAFAGGYLTNTNQSVAFVRNPARLATFDLDGAYSNPAGLAWIGQGLHIGFNWQCATQERDITSTFAPFAYNANTPGKATRHYNGNAKAPFIPSLDLAYQHKDWTVSAHVGVIGGGGAAKFEQGLPMFDAPLAMIVPALGSAASALNDPSLARSSYSSNMYMEGAQYIYGAQAGVTYRIFDNLGDAKHGLSVHLGARASIARNSYSGYLRDVNVYDAEGAATPAAQVLVTAMQGAAGKAQEYGQMAAAATDEAQKAQLQAASDKYAASAEQLGTLAYVSQGIELDCDQKGWGIAPIIGLDYRVGDLNIGARYEFKTHMVLENETDMSKIKGELLLDDYLDGVKTANDIPAILAIGAQYELFDCWRLMAGWNCYFDKKCDMAAGKEKHLNHNTHEITFGTEYDIKDFLTLSAGVQNTDYGTGAGFQNDMSFHCDSYMLNIGLRYKINKHVSIDAGYMRSFYKDYEKVHANYNKTGREGKDVFSRENQVFGVGVTWNM